MQICVHARGRTGTESIGVTGTTTPASLTTTMECYKWETTTWDGLSPLRVTFLNDGADPLNQNRDVFIEKAEVILDSGVVVEVTPSDTNSVHKGLWLPGVGCIPRTKYTEMPNAFVLGDAGWIHCEGYIEWPGFVIEDPQPEPPEEPKPHECTLMTFSAMEMIAELKSRNFGPAAKVELLLKWLN